jgi:hypothetical protein
VRPRRRHWRRQLPGLATNSRRKGYNMPSMLSFSTMFLSSSSVVISSSLWAVVFSTLWPVKDARVLARGPKSPKRPPQCLCRHVQLRPCTAAPTTRLHPSPPAARGLQSAVCFLFQSNNKVVAFQSRLFCLSMLVLPHQAPWLPTVGRKLVSHVAKKL